MIDATHSAEVITGEAVINDPVGLHARPAVKLVKLAKSFVALVEIKPEKQDKWVNAKSPNAVMKTRAAKGETLYIQAQGGDAPEAVEAIIEIVQSFR